MDKKIKPLTKFGIWMGVIIVMIAVCFIKENNETHFLDDLKHQNETEEISEEPVYKDYATMQNTLKENNYDYVFKINGENKYTYTGSRCNGLEKGFREYQDEVIKYIIGYDKKTYKIVNDEYIEIDNLYGDFDSTYLIIDKIFNDLSDVVYELNMESEESIYTYNLDNYNVVIRTNKENIESIRIAFSDITYDLEFANIGNCVKIDFNM